jgi:hypothetical protein
MKFTDLFPPHYALPQYCSMHVGAEHALRRVPLSMIGPLRRCIDAHGHHFEYATLKCEYKRGLLILCLRNSVSPETSQKLEWVQSFCVTTDRELSYHSNDAILFFILLCTRWTASVV